MTSSVDPNLRGSEDEIPDRLCIGCRVVDDSARMVRYTADRGQLVEGGQGRGAWLHPDPTCRDAALKRNAFARALRSAVSVPVDLEGTWPRSASTS